MASLLDHQSWLGSWFNNRLLGCLCLFGTKRRLHPAPRLAGLQRGFVQGWNRAASQLILTLDLLHWETQQRSCKPVCLFMQLHSSQGAEIWGSAWFRLWWLEMNAAHGQGILCAVWQSQKGVRKLTRQKDWRILYGVIPNWEKDKANICKYLLNVLLKV